MKPEQIRIRNLREDHDMTQAQAAAILNKSQQGYAHLENGRADLSIDDLRALCRYYNISADYILGLTDTPRPLK
ncbi:MAG: helix-turn-helix transcriptional regulator [Candidatus Fimenecus sp.]